MSKDAKKQQQPEPEFESNAITVVVRCRPFNAREKNMKAIPCIDFHGNGKSLTIWEKGLPNDRGVEAGEGGRNHSYTFDHSYHSEVTQSQVYDDIGAPVLKSSLAGFNTCIFAYGQTGSGKSYAMMGPDGGRGSDNDPGIIPRLCTALFDVVHQQMAANAEELAAAGDCEEHEKPPTVKFAVEVQYLEIYNERVRCLLNPKKDNLKVRQHTTMGVFVENLTSLQVNNYDEVRKLIVDGNNVRHIASTNMNDQSSRSHAIFVVNLIQKRISRTKDGTETTTERRSKINLVDLAGSERAKSTGAEGDTLKEGAQINKSLSILGLVISGLAEQSKNPTAAKKPFIPFRDSTLTYLLKESLGGNSKTFMVSTISPAHVNADETVSTLRYADRAKAIVTKACVNENASDKKIRELEEEVHKLQEMLRKYEEKQASQEKIGKQVPKLALGSLPGSPKKMPAPEVQPAAGPRQSKFKTSSAAAGVGGQHAKHHSQHKPLPLITPRSAIDRVIDVEEVIDSDGSEGGEYLEETPLMSLSTPRFEDDVELAKRQLALAEGLRNDLQLSDTQREAHQATEMKSREEAMKSSVPVVKATPDPYILNVDRCGDWVMVSLVAEYTLFGTAEAPKENVIGVQHVVIFGEGIAPHHLTLTRCRITNKVTLKPSEEAMDSVFLDPSDEPISDEVILSSGQTFYVGEEFYEFKFEDPSEKPLLTSRRSMRGQSMRKESNLSASGRGGGAAGSSNYSPASSGMVSPASTSPPPHSGGLRGKQLTPPNVSPVRAGSPEPSTPPTSSNNNRPAVPGLNLGGGGGPAVPALNLRGSQHIDPKQMGQRPRSASRTRDGEGGAAGGAPAGPVQIRTPRISNGGLRSARSGSGVGGAGLGHQPVNDESTCQFKHTFIFLGRCGSGKSATRSNLMKDDKFNPFSFFKKEVPATLPTFAFESASVKAGVLNKADITLLELSGNEAFTTLEQLIPDRRVTFVLTFRLSDPYDLSYFRNYIEFITCHSPSSDTTIVLLGTCRDELRGTDKAVLDSLSELEAQLGSFLKVLQPQENRRPRIFGRFAVNNKERKVVSASQKISKMGELLAWFGDHAVKCSKVDQDFPHGMVPLRIMGLGRKISEMKAQGKYILSTSDYKALARMIDPRYEKQLGELHKHTQLLHSWGVVHHHYRHANMKRSVVIDTNWVFGVIAVLSCCIDSRATGKGNGASGSGGMLPGEGNVSFSNYNAGANAIKGHDELLRAGVGVYSSKIRGFGERLPFDIAEIARVDPEGLVCQGVMTVPVAIELFRKLMKEKNIPVRDVDIILELLEGYDLILKGSRLKQWYGHFQQKQLQSKQARSEASPERQRSEQQDHSVLSNESLTSATNFHIDYLDGCYEEEEEEMGEEFYLVPSCFNAPLPGPVAMHVTPLLFGPSYRFSMNMVPPFFFSRFIARISRYAQKLYMGPAKVNPRRSSEEQLPAGTPGAVPPLQAANFWHFCVWIIDSSSARAFVRMVNRSLFITFHDHQEESSFHDGLLEIVRFLVHESPGMQCEEAVLCRRVGDEKDVDMSGGSADGDGGMELWVPLSSNVNSLEKLKEREEMALRSARGMGPKRDPVTGMPLEDNGEDDDDDLDTSGVDYEIAKTDRHSFDLETVMDKIRTDCFVDDDIMHKIEHALKLIRKGRTMEDQERGAKLEGAGVDQLVDALAHA